ncbi:unnamed protein product, partial [Dicrocoelium dendriticum]
MVNRIFTRTRSRISRMSHLITHPRFESSVAVEGNTEPMAPKQRKRKRKGCDVAKSWSEGTRLSQCGRSDDGSSGR